MVIACTKFTLIFVTCGLCIVMTQSSGSGDDRNHLRTPRPDRSQMKRLLDTAGRHKGVKDHRDEGTSKVTSLEGKKSRAYGETSLANQHPFEGHENDANSQHIASDRYKKTLVPWTNEQYRILLRLAYLNYSRRNNNCVGLFDWKTIKQLWSRIYGETTERKLCSRLSNLLKKMLSSEKGFDESMSWPRAVDYDLLQIYFLTENGAKSKHGSRILAEWKKNKFPGYERLTSEYLLNRAELLMNRVMKFSLEDPQEPIRKGQQVEWLNKHNDYLQYLWYKYPPDTTDRAQKIYNDAKVEFPGIRFLNTSHVYAQARVVSFRLMKHHESSFSYGGSAQDPRQIEYHSFLNENNSPSTSAGAHYYHGEMASSSSYPGPSHRQLNLDLRLDNLNRGDRSPDTNLRLGW